MPPRRLSDSLRQCLGLLVVLLLLGSAAAFYRVAPEAIAVPGPTPKLTTQDSSPDSGEGTTQTSEAKITSGEDEAAVTVTVTPEAGLAQIPTPMPEDGPGIDQVGILMLISPASGGKVTVNELVLLPDTVERLVLAPPDIARAGSEFEEAEPSASQVQISAGNQPVSIPDGSVTEEVSVAVAQADAFELYYELEGATVRSVPSTARRSLAAAAPLMAGLPQELPVRVIAAGPSVLGLSCPLLSLSDMACGEGTSLAVQTNTDLPFESAVVTMQFDEPRP